MKRIDIRDEVFDLEVKDTFGRNEDLWQTEHYIDMKDIPRAIIKRPNAFVIITEVAAILQNAEEVIICK